MTTCYNSLGDWPRAGGQQPIRDEHCGYQARVSRHEPEVEQGVEGEDMEGPDINAAA